MIGGSMGVSHIYIFFFDDEKKCSGHECILLRFKTPKSQMTLPRLHACFKLLK